MTKNEQVAIMLTKLSTPIAVLLIIAFAVGFIFGIAV